MKETGKQVTKKTTITTKSAKVEIEYREEESTTKPKGYENEESDANVSGNISARIKIKNFAES